MTPSEDRVKRKGGRVVTYQSLDSVLIFLTVLSLQSEQSDFPFSFFAMLVHRSLSLFESPHRAYKRLVLQYCTVSYNGVLCESSRLRRLVAIGMGQNGMITTHGTGFGVRGLELLNE